MNEKITISLQGDLNKCFESAEKMYKEYCEKFDREKKEKKIKRNILAVTMLFFGFLAVLFCSLNILPAAIIFILICILSGYMDYS